MNSLNSFDKTNREYSLGPTDDLVRFWRSKGQGHSRCKYCMWWRRRPHWRRASHSIF